MLMRILFISSLVLVWLPAGIAGAQQQYLDPGEAGFLLGGLFSRSEGYSGFGGRADYAFTDVLGAGVSLQRAENMDYEWIEFAPSVTALAVRPSKRWPVGLSFGAGYARIRQNRLDEDSIHRNRRISIYSFGVSLYLRLELSRGLVLYPTVGDAYTKAGYDVDDPDLGTYHESGKGQFASTFGFAVQAQRRFVFEATGVRAGGKISYVLSLILLLD